MCKHGGRRDVWGGQKVQNGHLGSRRMCLFLCEAKDCKSKCSWSRTDVTMLKNRNWLVKMTQNVWSDSVIPTSTSVFCMNSAQTFTYSAKTFFHHHRYETKLGKTYLVSTALIWMHMNCITLNPIEVLLAKKWIWGYLSLLQSILTRTVKEVETFPVSY